ncbi:hypothetical protein [Deinococcus altitudinis]|uniref:hypothetical protein n=1 Tax=Deinococcus altitudinis TaxID=468914 RepID=UPI0038913394
MILNHGPDPVQLGAVQIPVGGQAGLPVLPRPNTPTITVDRSLHAGSEVPSAFDLGFRCSDNAPELRQRYPLLSLLIFSRNAGTPSGLSVEVKQIYLPD